MDKIDNVINFADVMSDESLKPFMDLITLIMELPEDSLNETNVEVIDGMIQGAFTENLRQEMIQEAVDNFRESNYNRLEAKQLIETFKTKINNLIDEDIKPSELKRTLLNSVFQPIYNVFDIALERFNLYDFELPIQLDENAKAPTYAHEDDAAADLYAAETITLPAHSISNMIKTGVHIALPEGWAGIIIPRSSIGAKTGLRLSNSQGLIDTQYRGQLGVIYDNISDSDYTINLGDRIAQLYVVPVHRFKAKIVPSLSNTERGEGGFGSTGK